MKYAGWKAKHDVDSRKKRWDYKDADITVYIDEYGEDWETTVVGDDAQPVLSGYSKDKEYLREVVSTKEKAKVVAYGLLDAIHAVYSIQHREPLSDERVAGNKSTKEYFQKSMHVQIYYKSEDDISKGYATGVVVVGAEKDAFNQLAYEEYHDHALLYYMTDHTVEKERSFRYSVVDYTNNFDNYEAVEKSRSNAGIGEIEEPDEEDIPDCPECGDKIAENPDTCDKCQEAVKEAEEALDNFRGF